MIDNLDPKIIAALIGAFSALLSAGIAYWWSHKLKLKELALKEMELQHKYDTYLSNVEMKNRELQESILLHQKNIAGNALAELIIKRLEYYPKLWKILLTYGKNWKFNGKIYDGEWAKEFLNEINDCNCECGVYFSKDVYMCFHNLRSKLYEISASCSKDCWVSDFQLNEVNILLYGGQSAGLCALMKDDLGNYQKTSLSVRSTQSPN